MKHIITFLIICLLPASLLGNDVDNLAKAKEAIADLQQEKLHTLIRGHLLRNEPAPESHLMADTNNNIRKISLLIYDYEKKYDYEIIEYFSSEGDLLMFLFKLRKTEQYPEAMPYLICKKLFWKGKEVFSEVINPSNLSYKELPYYKEGRNEKAAIHLTTGDLKDHYKLNKEVNFKNIVGGKFFFILDAKVNLRKEPSTEAVSLGQFLEGTPVKIIEEGKEETINGITAKWYKVEPDHYLRCRSISEDFAKEGWVWGIYLHDYCSKEAQIVE